MTAEELVGEEWPVEGGLEGFDTVDEKSLKRLAARRKRHERAQKLEQKPRVLTAQGRPPSAAIFPEIAQNRKMVWVAGKKMKKWFEIRLVAMLKGARAGTPENLNEVRSILVLRFELPGLKCIRCSNSHPALTIVARGKTQVRVDSLKDPDFWCGIGKEQVEELLK